MHVLDFHNLIEPLDREVFFSEHWEQTPLVIARNNPDFYRSLLTSDDLEFVLSAAASMSPSSVDLSVHVENAAKLDNIDGMSSLYKKFQLGTTVRLRGVQRCWKPINQLCRLMERELSFPVQANLYCTPEDSTGLEKHFDDHDVLILQIAGSKQWRIYNPPVSLPLENLPPLRFERPEGMTSLRGNKFPKSERSENFTSTEVLLESKLEVGDLIYLPRGFPHQAWTTDEASAHLTIGIHVITWLDLMTVTLGLAGNQNVEFRKALPIGFANQNDQSQELLAKYEELLSTLPATANLRDTLEEISGSFMSSRNAFGEGILIPSDKPQNLSGDTVVERPEGLLLRLDVREETIGLVSYSPAVESIWLPRVFDVPLRFVFQNLRFRIRELPGGLTDKARLNLIRNLVHQKILRIQHAQPEVPIDERHNY